MTARSLRRDSPTLFRTRLLAMITAMAGAAVLAMPSPAAAAGRPSGSAEYAGLLRDSLDALTAEPPQIDRARAPIAGLLTGSLTRTGYVPGVALLPILDDLNSSPPNREDAAHRLRTLIAALRPPAGATGPDPGTAHDILKSVYASQAFQGLDAQDRQPGWLTRLADRIRAFLQRFASDRPNGSGGPPGNGAAGIGTLLVVLALVTLIAGAAWWMLRDRVRQTGMVEPAGTTGDPDNEWTTALAAGRNGDYREATRRAFRSALISVARHGRLPVDPAWTTRELLARAAGDSDLLNSLVPAARAFQTAWYSGRQVSEADWLSARERCEAIRALAARTAAGVA